MSTNNSSDIQNRLKSKVFWVGIISAIALMLKSLGVYEIEDATVSAIADAVLALFTIFGVFNNPTSKSKY